MAYTGDFRDDEAGYSERGYFDSSYVRQWDQFCDLFQLLVNKILHFRRGGVLLDVGTGVGALLHVARANGFDVKGIEVSPWAAGFAREEKGLDVRSGTLEEAGFNAGSFDVVVINHVLEHVPDPAAVLREAGRVLKDDGLLVVGVPNFGSIKARLASARWVSLRPGEHRWHFTPATLRKLVSRCGLGEVYFESGENHLPAGWSLKDIVLRLINRIAVLSGRSEAMLMFCVKS